MHSFIFFRVAAASYVAYELNCLTIFGGVYEYYLMEKCLKKLLLLRRIQTLHLNIFKGLRILDYYITIPKRENTVFHTKFFGSAYKMVDICNF